MQDLRYQLKQTLGEEKEVAEEVERVKRVLQLERGASARREKVPESDAYEIVLFCMSLFALAATPREQPIVWFVLFLQVHWVPAIPR